MSVSSPSGEWKAETGSVDDPLQAYRRKPVISGAGPDASYVGRVVVELWSDGVSDDARCLPSRLTL